MKHHIEKFLEDSNNAEALKILAKKMADLQAIQSLDMTLSAEEMKAEVLGRDKAIAMVSEWINELFSITKEEIENLASDEDDMISVHEQVES